MIDGTVRRRDPREFFGLERALWEDRHAGTLSGRQLELLAKAQRELGAAVAASDPQSEAAAADIKRTRALLDAITVARDVLSAARDALRDRDGPVFGPRA